MKLRGYKQATAHSHERTKNSNPSKNYFSRRHNSNSNLLIYSKNPPKSFEVISGRMVFSQGTHYLPYFEPNGRKCCVCGAVPCLTPPITCMGIAIYRKRNQKNALNSRRMPLLPSGRWRPRIGRWPPIIQA